MRFEVEKEDKMIQFEVCAEEHGDLSSISKLSNFARKIA